MGTPTYYLELVKLIINSVITWRGAHYYNFDIKNFYLVTLLHRPEYVKVQLSDIPQEFINEYDLKNCTQYGWVYFKICKVVNGFPQSGILANNILRKRFGTASYYEVETTQILWLHKWRPILFYLIVNDFGIEYVEERHAKHLLFSLEEHYKVTTEWERNKYTGIDLHWNHQQRT